LFHNWFHCYAALLPLEIAEPAQQIRVRIQGHTALDAYDCLSRTVERICKASLTGEMLVAQSPPDLYLRTNDRYILAFCWFSSRNRMLEWEMQISIDRKPFGVKTGNVVLMPANHPHALRAVTKSKMLLTMVRSH
jgi:hypothetical protein